MPAGSVPETARNPNLERNQTSTPDRGLRTLAITDLPLGVPESSVTAIDVDGEHITGYPLHVLGVLSPVVQNDSPRY